MVNSKTVLILLFRWLETCTKIVQLLQKKRVKRAYTQLQHAIFSKEMFLFFLVLIILHSKNCQNSRKMLLKRYMDVQINDRPTTHQEIMPKKIGMICPFFCILAILMAKNERESIYLLRSNSRLLSCMFALQVAESCAPRSTKLIPSIVSIQHDRYSVVCHIERGFQPCFFSLQAMVPPKIGQYRAVLLDIDRY